MIFIFEITLVLDQTLFFIYYSRPEKSSQPRYSLNIYAT